MSTDNYRTASTVDEPDVGATQALDLGDRTAPEGSTAYESTDPGDTEVKTRTRHVVDRFDGAIGLLVLRLVTGGIVGIHGLHKIQDLDATKAFFTQVGVPSPATMAPVVGGLEIAIGVALVLGLAVRFAGLGVAIVAVGALVMVKWKSGQVFTDGQSGFAGELELMLAAAGLTLLGVGGGGWGLDHKVRNRGKS